MLHPIGFWMNPGGGDWLLETIYGRESYLGDVVRESVTVSPGPSATAIIYIWIEQSATNAIIQVQGGNWYEPDGTPNSAATDSTIYDLGETCDTVKITRISDSSVHTSGDEGPESWSITQNAGTFTDDVAFDPGTASTEYGYEYQLSIGDTGGQPEVADADFVLKFTFIKSGRADRVLIWSGALTVEAEASV